jgi:hypothetical protein
MNHRQLLNRAINDIDQVMGSVRILNEPALNNALAIAQGQIFRAMKLLTQIRQGLEGVHTLVK